jgi:hypothetical protein
MFETVIAAMLKHKQIVFATIAVAALSGMVIAPATQVARAQLGEDIANDVLDSVFGDGDDEDNEEAAATEEVSGDDNQDIDQTQEQTNEQEQEAEQEVDQESSQDETNVQANELDTGANTATVAQSNDADQDVAAAAEASDADASSSAEDDDHDSKHKKHHHSDGSDSDTTTSSAEAIVSATAEATGIVDQDNDATVRQDSSIHDVDLSNNVAFGDDTNTQIAVPIIDQDQRAANLAEQRAANLNVVDIDEDGTGGTDTEPIRTFTCNPSTLAGIAVTRSGSTCSATGDTNIITGGVCDAVEGTRTVSGGQNPQATCSFPATAV